MPFAGQLSYLTPLDGPEVITRQEEKIPWSTSFLQTANRHHGLINKMRKLDREFLHDFEKDENFNGWSWLAERQEEYGDVIPAFENNLQEYVNEAVSEEHLLDTIRRVRYEQEMIKEASAGGITATLAGGLLAFVADPIAWVTLGASHKLIMSNPAFVALKGSRLGVAGVHAGAGMFEAGVDEFFLHHSQYLRTTQESALNIAMSGLFSAAIGALFPHPVAPGTAAGRKSMQQLYDEGPFLHHVVPDTIDGRAMGMAPESLGAAAVEKGSEVLALKPGPFSRVIVNEMSPLGRAVNTITEWTNTLRPRRSGSVADAADNAFRSHWSLMENLVESHLLTPENLKGESVVSAEAVRNFYRSWYVSYLTDAKEIYQNTMQSLGQSTKWYHPQAWRNLQQRHFNLDVGSYRLALEGGKEATWKPGAESMKHLSGPDALMRYTAGIREASNKVTEFYKKFADEMVQFGMIDAGDIRPNYFGHMYNRGAINANPDTFRALLRERFMKQPDDAFVTSTYGKKFADMSADEKAVAFADWEAVTRGQREQYAQDLLDHAAEVLGDGPQDIKALKKLKTAAGREQFMGELRAAREQATKRRAELEALHHKAEQRHVRMDHMTQQRDRYLAQPIPTGKAAFAAHHAKIKRLDGVISEQKRWLTAKKNALQKSARELNALEVRISRTEARLASHKSISGIVGRALNKRQKELKKALIEQRRGKKLMEAVYDTKTLDDQVQAVMEAIRDRHKTPYGFLPDDVVEASGRVRQRQINWGDMLADGRLHEFMQHDPTKVLLGYTEDVGSRLALRMTFGEESMATSIAKVRSLYDDAVTAARNAGDSELEHALLKGSQRMSDDVHHLRDSILGRLRVGSDPHTAFMFWTRQLRQVNFLRSMGRSAISSMTDPVLVKAANDASLRQLVKSMWHNLGNFKKIPNKETRRMIEGFELAQAYNRQMVTYGIDDFAQTGMGYGFGSTREITGAVERGMSSMTMAMNHVNQQNLWNRYMRHVAAELFMGNAVDELPRFAAGKLGPDKVGKWARLGIDQQKAARIAKLFENHADIKQGVAYPRMSDWVTADPEAARAFTTAWTTLSTESLVIPGLGDLPKFMSQPAGKMLLQFQAWNISVSRRFLHPMQQKSAAFGGHYTAEKYGNFVLAMGLGLFTYFVRTHLGGTQPDRLYKQLEDFRDGKNVDILWEAFLRSPLPGAVSTPIEAVGKAIGPGVNSAMNQLGIPGLFPNAGGKNIDRSAAALFFGPSYGTLETAFLGGQHLASALDPDVDSEQALRHSTKHMLRLYPFQNLWWASRLVQAGQQIGAIPELVED